MLAILLLIASNSYTQSSLLLSTLDNANQLRDKGNFQKAANVLDEFNTKYPGNNWIMRLYAETLYWMKDYDKAEIIYKEAINIHPDNLDIKYEYAILLFDIGKYNKAKDLI